MTRFLLLSVFVVAAAGCRAPPAKGDAQEPAWAAKVRALADPAPPLGRLVWPAAAPRWVYTPSIESGALLVCGVAGRGANLPSQRTEAYRDALAVLSEALAVEVSSSESATGTTKIKPRRSETETLALEEVEEAAVVEEWADEKNLAGYGAGLYYMLVSHPWEGSKQLPPGIATEDPTRVPDWIYRVPPERDGEIYQWGTGGGTPSPRAARRLALQDAQRRLTKTIAFRIDALSIYQRSGKFETDQSAYEAAVQRSVLERAVVVSIWPDVSGLAGLGRGRVYALMRMPTAGLPAHLAENESADAVTVPRKGRAPAWIDQVPQAPGSIYAWGAHPIRTTLNPYEAFERAVAQAQERLATQIEVEVTNRISIADHGHDEELLSQRARTILKGLSVVAMWPDTQGKTGEPRIYVLAKVLLPKPVEGGN